MGGGSTCRKQGPGATPHGRQDMVAVFALGVGVGEHEDYQL